MQSVRKHDSASAPVREAMRKDATSSGALPTGNKSFVRTTAQAGNVDKTTFQPRTARAMNNTKLVGMSNEGIAIANYCRNVPPEAEIDLHASVNPYVRAYAAGLERLTNTPGPLFVNFDNGAMSIRSRSVVDSFPLFSMHPTSEGMRYTVQGRPLNGSSSFPDVEMGQSHLSMCRLVAQEAVDPQGARPAAAAYQE